ncbi:MAG: pentapeptide repeat-containing protein, partial [Candidatus Angelobacter sp.]
MSETPEQPAEMPTNPTGIAWGDFISPERLAQLKELFKRQQIWAEQIQQDIKQSVFYRIHLAGADVFWLAALALDGAEGNLDKAVAELRALPFINLSALHLEGANLLVAQLQGAYLSQAHLEGANLLGAQMGGANLGGTWLKDADLRQARLQKAFLFQAQLEGANLSQAHLEGASLYAAQLEGANLSQAHLEGSFLFLAQLQGTDLRQASFDKASVLNDAQLDDVRMDQVTFDNTNLTAIPWETVKRLGDEQIAKGKPPEGEKRPHPVWKVES